MIRPGATCCVLLLAAVVIPVASAGEPADVFIAAEPERAWLIAFPPPTVEPETGGELGARIALWSPKGAESDKPREVPLPAGKPRLAAAFRERYQDRWGLCLLSEQRVRWADGLSGRSAAAPPLGTIHSHAASSKLLYVLGDSLATEPKTGRPGEPALLIFNGHLWRQWPHALPEPTRRSRFPKLLAFDDGFALMYFLDGSWVRYDCRDGLPPRRVELDAEDAPPFAATLLADGKQILAVQLAPVPGTVRRTVRITQLTDGRWTRPRDLELVGFQPTRTDAAAFDVQDGRLWAIFSDADKNGRVHYGSMDLKDGTLTLEEAARLSEWVDPPAPISAHMLITLGVLGILLLLIWRRGARDARWLVRSAALPVAPWGRRIGAAIIDLLPAILLSGGLFRDGWVQIGEQVQSANPQLPVAGWIAIASLLGVYLLHTTFSELATRATLGKRLMGLTVVDERGRPARRGQILIRNLFRAADLVPVLLLVMLVTRYRQRLGDLMARTVVAVKLPRPEPQEEPAEGEEPDDTPPDE